MGYIQDARENHVKKKVEEALRSKMKQRALKECDYYTAKYAECASGRTLSVVWRCRQQAKELNGCLHQFIEDPKKEKLICKVVKFENLRKLMEPL
ncbi:Cytochrome c oxidase biogenesis protein Cmc [Spatholobus suberectus]|nr:Cytochrome c oxidase biogenesis protein Cmc [Spatholobus suberectus]